MTIIILVIHLMKLLKQNIINYQIQLLILNIILNFMILFV